MINMPELGLKPLRCNTYTCKGTAVSGRFSVCADVSIVQVHCMTTTQLQSSAVQVPSAGILTNGTAYIFYKCHHDGQPNGQPVVTCSDFLTVDLRKGISARSAEDTVMEVVGTMVQLFVDQQKALSSFWSSEAVQ